MNKTLYLQLTTKPRIPINYNIPRSYSNTTAIFCHINVSKRIRWKKNVFRTKTKITIKKKPQFVEYSMGARNNAETYNLFDPFKSGLIVYSVYHIRHTI